MITDIARALSHAVDALPFAAPITHVYNPLSYAWDLHEAYLRRYGQGRKRVIFLGMNPGPFGMVQTGIPFGEVAAVRTYLGLSGHVHKPAHENPKKPIIGLDCTRSEVSGQRLWSLFSKHYPNPDDFFADHFVSNYCPLAFLENTRNITPDKLPKHEAAPLLAACDTHLQRMIEILQPTYVVGVGKYARKQAESALKKYPHLQFFDILHPSPASPAANRGWLPIAEKQLYETGIWQHR